jgi:hypothetical protein
MVETKPKVAIILLTWQRVLNLKNTLHRLSVQPYQDFDVFISNANLDENKIATINSYVGHYSDKLNIKLSHDGNDLYTFRRLTVARDLAKQGYDIILYIDDDVVIDCNHVKKCVDSFEPRTYKSEYTWSFYKSGRTYYRGRQRRKDNDKTINYCGTGVAMIDASIFLEDGLFDYPEGALKIEDLWLSYYAQHVLGWELKYVDLNAAISGRDNVALFKKVQKEEINKDVFLKKLVDLGWQIPENI